MTLRRTSLIDVVFPGDANHHGTLFGGVALAHMDRVAFIAATRHGRVDFVTASSERTDFLAAAKIGDIVEVTGTVVTVGRRSLSVKVELSAENPLSGERRLCARSRFNMVATGARIDHGFRLPPLPDGSEPAVEAGSALRMAGIVFPDDTSHYGSLYGGNALAAMAKGASVAATRHSRKAVVMAATNEASFKSQIGTGEVIEVRPVVSRTGMSSMTVDVELWAQPIHDDWARRCGSASFTMVAVGANGRPVPVEQEMA